MKTKIFICAAFAAFLIASCKNNYEQDGDFARKPVPVAGISIETAGNSNSISLVSGTTYTLRAKVLPLQATDKKLTYSSTSATVASIDENGLITACGAGTAKITVKAANKTKTITVTVTEARVDVAGIAVKPEDENVSIVKGGTYRLSASVTPENATNKSLAYFSGDADIASVDASGLITARMVGNTTVSISAENNITKTVNVVVTESEIAVTGIEVETPLPADPIRLNLGDTYTLNAKAMPDTATNKTLRYSFAPENIVSINENGVLTALAEGKTTLTITTANGISKTINIEVSVVHVTDIVFDPPLPAEPVRLVIGETYTLKAKAIPDNATNKTLQFTTSNSSKAWLYGDGNSSVKAEADGEATVTVSSVSDPSVKKEIRFVITKKPEIQVETKSLQAESAGGGTSLTVKTLYGKLDYTPKVVGGGKKWVKYADKDTSNPSEDAVRLTVTANKTVWERTAYIKFKGADGNYIKSGEKGPDKKYKDLEVKLTQKKNEHPVVTIKWVYGIGEPQQSEKEKIEIPNIYPKKYWDDSYVFFWNESTSTKWFNNRKANNLGISTPDGGDTNQCWAKTSANMLQWWFEQNESNINLFKTKKGITGSAADAYQHFYKRGLDDKQEKEKTYIANVFRTKAHNGAQGDYIMSGIMWYLFGNDSLKKYRNYSPELFKDVFSKEDELIVRQPIKTREDLNNTLKEALDSGKAVGLDIWGNGYGHAITLWGAAFDEQGNVIAIYVVDNNNRENRIFPYGIHYKKDIYADSHEDNEAFLFNFPNNTFDNRKYVGQITTLDKGEDLWQQWFAAHP
ncbi:MAG: IdeS/Mac family cysteine endopeptidase [Treponema sp.]